ncbi:hypothetical protein BpHYR1_044727 [Brachionus plicatilis]|uniref:Uncharacterized protein n=1 Tax=Brachionus plicatilis TaxID=10195 RepID=A0A3M7QRM5_BRAPC|nr:hypothetical protein BpHYR1_044727 [Brachionus plicatilis]
MLSRINIYLKKSEFQLQFISVIGLSALYKIDLCLSIFNQNSLKNQTNRLFDFSYQNSLLATIVIG